MTDRLRRRERDGAYLVGYHDRLGRRYMPRRCLPGLRSDYRRGWDDAHAATLALLKQFETIRMANHG